MGNAQISKEKIRGRVVVNKNLNKILIYCKFPYFMKIMFFFTFQNCTKTALFSQLQGTQSHSQCTGKNPVQLLHTIEIYCFSEK